MIPNIEEFEERAAICEYDGRVTRKQAEDAAARDQGFDDAADYWSWLADYVVKGGVPR